MNKRTSGKKKVAYILGWGKILVLTLLVVAGVRFFLLESFYISSTAMETAVLNGDYLLVNKSPLANMPRRNRIMLFSSPLLKDTTSGNLFLSRCVGMPGDTLKLENNSLSINGKEVPKSPNTLARYRFTNDIGQVMLQQMKQFKIPVREPVQQGDTMMVSLTPFEEYHLREELPKSINVLFTPLETTNYSLTVPSKGLLYRLNADALIACKEIILAESGGKAVFRDNKLYLDGKETTFFMFHQNYYWMLSDNTTEGIDSRHLGFIPESHVIGTPLFIWLSKQPGLSWREGYRWSRIFNSVN